MLFVLKGYVMSVEKVLRSRTFALKDTEFTLKKLVLEILEEMEIVWTW